MRTILATLASAGIVLCASAASAAPGRVAILGPERSPVVPRLQRNFAENPALLASAVVSSCTRGVVAKHLYDLDADTAICTDGDVITVWRLEGDDLRLVDAVPVVHSDDRSIELVAARVTIAARSGRTSRESSVATIVANGSDPRDESSTIIANPTPAEARDATPVPIAPPPPERIAPRLLFSAGPMLLASKPGSSFAMSVAAEIGVSRLVTFNPWIATVPVPRSIETPNGSASYRPTLFGIGFGVPLRSWKKTLVPRLGAGYALIWMRTWPDEARGIGRLGTSEDLWAPAMYATASLSVGITERIRVAAEGLLGTSTHRMTVRMAAQKTDEWGAPLASLGARAELVLP